MNYEIFIFFNSNHVQVERLDSSRGRAPMRDRTMARFPKKASLVSRGAVRSGLAS